MAGIDADAFPSCKELRCWVVCVARWNYTSEVLILAKIVVMAPARLVVAVMAARAIRLIRRAYSTRS